MKLLVINSQDHDPQKNLDLEEELKKMVNTNQYVLRFWINDPVLVMGRFQKEEYEAQTDFLKANKIPLLRRTTGGGTVYHDRGTLNISFCKPKNPVLNKGEKDSTTLVSWIAQALKELHLDVRQDERNALFIGDKKILGSAVSLTGEILLFHCSLLIETDLKKLEGAINWNPLYSPDGTFDNFVKSHRSPVVNIRDISPHLTLDTIKNQIEKNILKNINKEPSL